MKHAGAQRRIINNSSTRFTNGVCMCVLYNTRQEKKKKKVVKREAPFSIQMTRRGALESMYRKKEKENIVLS